VKREVGEDLDIRGLRGFASESSVNVMGNGYMQIKCLGCEGRGGGGLMGLGMRLAWCDAMKRRCCGKREGLGYVRINGFGGESDGKCMCGCAVWKKKSIWVHTDGWVWE